LLKKENWVSIRRVNDRAASQKKSFESTISKKVKTSQRRLEARGTEEAIEI